MYSVMTLQPYGLGEPKFTRPVPLYKEALRGVFKVISSHQDLEPVHNPGLVVALKPYGVLQAWRVEDAEGNKSTVAIVEVHA